MARELELSAIAPDIPRLQPLVAQFEAEHDAHVRLRVLTGDTGWADLVKVALYSDGPDVSEIGSAWLGDRVAVNALRPFAEAALRLVQFLTRPAVEAACGQAVGLLPARLDGLASPPFSTDPLWQLAIAGIRTGRPVPVTRSWGLMEDRLTREFGGL